MSLAETYKIAHTARCKLHLAADRPDRDLRFILGHAFTLDKLRLRIAEIEVDSNSDEDEDDGLPEMIGQEGERRVSFGGRAKSSHGVSGRRRSPPPPPQLDDSTDSESDEEDDLNGDDGEDELGLTRFPSASGQHRGVEREPYPSVFSDEELKAITDGDGNQELADAYAHVAGCPCHGEKAVHAEKMWEIPSKEKGGPRLAVVQVAA